MANFIKEFGHYPAEYVPEVHGPYDPARYYGKVDKPLAQVKLGELGAWLGRRNKSPQAAAGAVSRAFWRWNHKYCNAKRAGVAPFFHVVLASSAFFYIINYGRITRHKNAKYH